MTAAPGAERLLNARSEVNRACNLLIAPSPEALSSAQDSLRRAIAALLEYRATHRPQAAGDPSAESVVRSLRTEISRAGKLLENLASFHRGWERILGTLSGGYTANGDPAPVARLGRLCCRG